MLFKGVGGENVASEPAFLLSGSSGISEGSLLKGPLLVFGSFMSISNPIVSPSVILPLHLQWCSFHVSPDLLESKRHKTLWISILDLLSHLKKCSHCIFFIVMSFLQIADKSNHNPFWGRYESPSCSQMAQQRPGVGDADCGHRSTNALEKGAQRMSTLPEAGHSPHLGLQCSPTTGSKQWQVNCQ